MPASGTTTFPRSRVAPETDFDPGWNVVVLNDDVNLMAYLVHVFRRVFGFEAAVARQRMLEVHEQGRSVVWTGPRERAEHFVHTLQQWHLAAQLEIHA